MFINTITTFQAIQTTNTSLTGQSATLSSTITLMFLGRLKKIFCIIGNRNEYYIQRRYKIFNFRSIIYKLYFNIKW